MTVYATTPIPGSSVYRDQQQQALTAWQRARASLQTRTGQIWQQYGFKGEFDPETGSMRNVGVDVNNQYGDYQMMLGRQGSELDGADENAQERGLGGGPGLGSQMANKARFLQGRQHLDFARDFQNQQSDVQRDWQEGHAAYQQALFDAERNAARAAVGGRQFNEPPAEQPAGPVAPVVGPDPRDTPVSAPGANPAARKPVSAYGTQHASRAALAKYVQTHGGRAALNAQQARSQGLNKRYKKKGGR
jgi:hypothetical protein